MLKGISQKHLNLLKAFVETQNNMIQELKEQGIRIHDSQDFMFAIKEIRYSPAQDKVIATFEQIEKIVEDFEV